ncbi:MAG: hypothetical protein JW966_04455 [Anaerolineae bacterium]|nr:hypothetical protein [Anaerolineae bacterium]
MRRRLMLFGGAVIIIGGGMAALLGYLGGEPGEIRVSLEPERPQAAVSEQFTLDVTIENVSLDTVTITGIGFDDALLDGVTVVQSDPPFRGSEDRSYPLYGSWTEYTLDRDILDGNTLTVSFTMQGTVAGVHSGDVTVWVDGTPFARARRAELEIAVR